MKIYQAKSHRFTGTDFREVHKKALALYKQIKSKTKRRPHVRSAYFKGDKIFLDYFWQHLHQKNWRDRVRRLVFYPCALEVIKKATVEPISKQNPNRSSKILHRFAGVTPSKELFFVHINEDKKTDQKSLISVFPAQ